MNFILFSKILYSAITYTSNQWEIVDIIRDAILINLIKCVNQTQNLSYKIIKTEPYRDQKYICCKYIQINLSFVLNSVNH